MESRFTAASIAGLVFLAISPLPLAAGERTPDADQQTLTLVLPKGDPEAGREAFHALSCDACHAVASEESSPPKISGPVPVPVLGRVQARLAPGDLATAILSPSHDVSPEVRRNLEGTRSPMGDFTEALTLRQLVDLVAYVRSLDDRY